jgi:hypothetical protein
VFLRSFDNGATATSLQSHKAQGWTADHVVVAAERLDSKAAYVACSRGRQSCVILTPDKARLMERFPEGNRRAPLDVLSEMRTASASVLNRVGGWKQLAIDIARQATNRLHQHLEGAMQIRQSKQDQRQAL